MTEPGAELLAAVAVMDRLRSPGGCPWDAAQTHTSLAPYLLEETYEALEAIGTGDVAALREELGDVLLQVLFHARVAQEAPGGFDIDDVARDLVGKLVRRHPHVFAAGSAHTPDEVEQSWHQLKAREKARTSVLDGVPLSLPALALAAKLLGRARRGGVDAPMPDGDGIGDRLLRLVSEALDAGVDPEDALRASIRAYRDRVRAAEAS